MNWLDKVADLASFNDKNKYIHSRIALLSEAAGKTRLIAIGDY